MKSKVYKFLLTAGVIITMSGCKIAVMVPAGGKVVSSSATRGCDGTEEGRFCTFDISHQSLPFSESFTAIARPGWQFVRWERGSAFLCADSANPTCSVSIAGTDFGAAILAQFETGYLMPIFKDVGIDTDGDGIRNELDDDDDNDGLLDVDDPCPRNPELACSVENIVANGKIWLQPDLFANLSWEDIDAACPAGICEGSLNGQDLNGWNWASFGEVSALLSSYGPWDGSIEHCPSFDSFFYDGWRKTNSIFLGGSVAAIFGFTSSQETIAFVSNSGGWPCHMYVGGSQGVPVSFDPTGAWFYRSP